MSRITWKQFKDAVESAGVKDSDELCYIDVGEGDSIDVRRGEIDDGKSEFIVEREFGRRTSPAKTRAARRNARLGGWPKGKKRKKRATPLGNRSR